MKKYLIFALFLVASILSGQSTATLSGTVTDSDSIAWANATWTYNLTNVQGPLVNVCGGTVVNNVFGSLSNTGVFSTGSLTTNKCISPSGTLWQLKICSNTSATCQTLPGVAINSSTYNAGAYASSLITAPRFTINGAGFGYATEEVLSPIAIGSFLYITTPGASCLWEVWTGTAWTCGSQLNAITALYGDGSATGPGNSLFTLDTVNGSPGTCGDASDICSLTINGKGLTTAQTYYPIIDNNFLSLSPWVMPTNPHFGAPSSCANAADPTGVADSTCAFQASFQYAATNHGNVLITSGTYKISSTLLIYPAMFTGTVNSLSIVGAGTIESVHLECGTVPSGYCISIAGTGNESGSPVTRYSISNIWIDGQKNAVASGGLWMDRNYIVDLRNVTSTGWYLPESGGDPATGAHSLYITNAFNVSVNGGNYANGSIADGPEGGNTIQVGAESLPSTPYNTSNIAIVGTIAQWGAGYCLGLYQASGELMDSPLIMDNSLGDCTVGNFIANGNTSATAIHNLNFMGNHLESPGTVNPASTVLGRAYGVNLIGVQGFNLFGNDMKDAIYPVFLNAAKASSAQGNIIYFSGAYTKPACALSAITETSFTVNATMTCTAPNMILNGEPINITGTTQYNTNDVLVSATVSGTSISWTSPTSGLTPESSGTVTLGLTAIQSTNGSHIMRTENTIYSGPTYYDALSSFDGTSTVDQPAWLAGGNTWTTPNTTQGLTAKCVQYPCQLGSVYLVNQAATIASTTLYAPTVDGSVYELGCVTKTTQAGSAGTVTCTVTCSGASATPTSISLTSLNATNNVSTRSLFNTGGSACSYSTTVTGNVGGAYDVAFYIFQDR